MKNFTAGSNVSLILIANVCFFIYTRLPRPKFTFFTVKLQHSLQIPLGSIVPAAYVRGMSLLVFHVQEVYNLSLEGLC